MFDIYLKFFSLAWKTWPNLPSVLQHILQNRIFLWHPWGSGLKFEAFSALQWHFAHPVKSKTIWDPWHLIGNLYFSQTLNVEGTCRIISFSDLGNTYYRPVVMPTNLKQHNPLWTCPSSIWGDLAIARTHPITYQWAPCCSGSSMTL